jgi:lambda repressor-like predicted transcriptional regulator
MTTGYRNALALGASLGTMLVAGNVHAESMYTARPLALFWINPITSFTSRSVAEIRAAKLPSKTSHEIVAWMREDGLPIAIIADIAGVERKTVYAWLAGGAVRPHNQMRLQGIYELLAEQKVADLRNLYRFWNRQMDNGSSLGALFKEGDLNEVSIRSALQELWPLALKQQAAGDVRPVASLKANPFLRDTREANLSHDS